MKTNSETKKFLKLMGILLLVMIFLNCSNDDEDIGEQRPTAAFGPQNEYIANPIMGNTIVLENVTVGQSSWIVAVNVGDENSTDFIAEPVSLQKGPNREVPLVFNHGELTEDENGHEVILKLYADTGSIPGSWDTTDKPIMNSNNELVTKIIKIFPWYHNGPGFANFESFDENEDGSLDAEEVLSTYRHNFPEWDDDGDGSLSLNEFYNTFFALTDINENNRISEEEWTMGFYGLFQYWIEDDFATFDANSDDDLSLEEWNSIFSDSNWFQTYDSDSNNLITGEEWNSGLFKDWDINGNNLIGEDEFAQFWPYVRIWTTGAESFTFAWFDTNYDGVLSFQEALESYNFPDYFTIHWDVDNDGSLNKEEFYNAIFFNTDFTNDKIIDQEEWDSGYAASFSNWVDYDFSPFDQNQNGNLNEDEWFLIFEESGWFEAFDTGFNGKVNEDEWLSGLFKDWDTNANGKFEEEEFESYYPYVQAWIRW